MMPTSWWTQGDEIVLPKIPGEEEAAGVTDGDAVEEMAEAAEVVPTETEGEAEVVEAPEEVEEEEEVPKKREGVTSIPSNGRFPPFEEL